MLKKLTKGLAFLLVLCLLTAMSPGRALAADESDMEPGTFYRIFHLDVGRKYFSPDQIRTLIDVLAENGYTHLELAVGNDALRFLLNDMSLTVGDVTYSGDQVAAGIHSGNTAYYDAGSDNELTEEEMDHILQYAAEKGISVIPLINTPGHMDAIIDCMESLGIENAAYLDSTRTIDVTNDQAIAFTQALISKYVRYFADKGCEVFNLGADEYANDMENSGFAGLIRSEKYGAFIEYVNSIAAIIKASGMIPMAFNDGIYYNSDTGSGTFDPDILIAYWTSGWNGYSPASATFLKLKGHKIINTNDAWYYVVGRDAANPSGYTIASARNGAEKVSVTDLPGGSKTEAVGAMQCVWCDTPGAVYNADEVIDLIVTMASNNADYFGGDTELWKEMVPISSAVLRMLWQFLFPRAADG